MADKKEKLTYEQLNDVAKNLAEQNRQMEEYIKNNHTNEAIARLNFLFKVLEFSKHFDKEYLANAVEDIKHILVMSNGNEPEIAESETKVEE